MGVVVLGGSCPSNRGLSITEGEGGVGALYVGVGWGYCSSS